MQSEETWMELHVLHRHGWSIAALAREFGLDWRTAHRYATAPGPLTYRPRARPAELSAACLAQGAGFLHAAPASRFASMAMTFALSGATAKRSRRISSGPSG